MSKQKSWEHHMRSYERSKMSKKVYCEKHKLNLHTFDYWRGKLSKQEEKPEFVRVKSPSQSTAPVEIKLGYILIRVPENFSKSALETIFEVARARD